MTLALDHHESPPKRGILLAFALTAVLAAPTAVPGDYAGWAMRIVCAMLVVIGLGDKRDWAPSDASRTWTRCVAALLASYALSTIAVRSLGAAALNTAVVEDGKIAFYFALSVGLIAACASERIRRAIVLSVILTGFAVVALSVITFVSFAQMNFTYDDIRAAKYVLSEHYGIVLNSTVHAGIASLILFWTMNVGKFAKLVATVLLIGFAAITTTRTPLGALLMGFVVLAGTRVFHRISMRQRIAAALAIIGLPIIYLLLLDASDLARLAVAIDTALAGRAELWLIAAQSFLNNPIFGSGPGSWSIIVPQFALRIAPLFTGKIGEALSLTTGGYHNTFVTALAERGIVGLLVILTALAFVIKTAFRLRANAEEFKTDMDRRIVVALPLLWIYISIRGLFEESGLFGRANSDVDFLSLILLALTLAYANNLDANRKSSTVEQNIDDFHFDQS